MWGPLAFGLGIGAGLQAWRSFPAQHPQTVDGLALVFVLGLIAAYAAGRWKRVPGATATATATATAAAQASSVNTVQIVLGDGPRAAHGSVRVPTESAPWMVDASERLELDADDLDGMDILDAVGEERAEP